MSAWRCLFAGLCIAGTTVVDNPIGKMILFSIAGFGMFGAQPCFWALPATFLSGPSAAAGLAMVNSLGNLSGFFGPYVMGRVKDATGSYTIALLAISVILGFAMLMALSLHHDQKLENPALHDEEEDDDQPPPDRHGNSLNPRHQAPGSVSFQEAKKETGAFNMNAPVSIWNKARKEALLFVNKK